MLNIKKKVKSETQITKAGVSLSVNCNNAVFNNSNKENKTIYTNFVRISIYICNILYNNMTKVCHTYRVLQILNLFVHQKLSL